MNTFFKFAVLTLFACGLGGSLTAQHNVNFQNVIRKIQQIPGREFSKILQSASSIKGSPAAQNIIVMAKKRLEKIAQIPENALTNGPILSIIRKRLNALIHAATSQ